MRRSLLWVTCDPVQRPSIRPLGEVTVRPGVSPRPMNVVSHVHQEKDGAGGAGGSSPGRLLSSQAGAGEGAYMLSHHKTTSYSFQNS